MPLVFDKAGTLERVGGDADLLCDLLRLCREQCDSRLMVLVHEARHKNFAAVKGHAHFLKGSLGTVGAVAALEAAKKLEQSCAAGLDNGIEPLVDVLIEKINEFFLVVDDQFPR